MLGTTVLYSSGDDGVAGNGGVCLNANGAFRLAAASPMRSPHLVIDRPAIPPRHAIQPRLPCDLPVRHCSWCDADQSGVDGERPGGRVRAGHLQRRRVQQHLHYAGLSGGCGHGLPDEPPAAIHERAVQQQWKRASISSSCRGGARELMIVVPRLVASRTCLRTGELIALHVNSGGVADSSFTVPTTSSVSEMSFYIVLSH